MTWWEDSSDSVWWQDSSDSETPTSPPSEPVSWKPPALSSRRLLPASSQRLVRLTENHIASLSLESLDELEDHLRSVILDRRLERRPAINDDIPLVKLPTEIVLEIGRLLLKSSPIETFITDKGPFGADGELERSIDRSFERVLPFSQTCVGLRTKLQMMRREPIFVQCKLSRQEDLGSIIRDLQRQLRLQWQIRKKYGPGPYMYEGSVAMLFDLRQTLRLNRSLRPSTAAAIAGYLESRIYGCLQEPPVIYIRTEHPSHEPKSPDVLCTQWFASYLRERGTIKIPKKSPQNMRILGVEESKKLWEFIERGKPDFIWCCHKRFVLSGGKKVEHAQLPEGEDCFVEMLLRRGA